MSMSNFLENKVLNHIAGKEVFVAPEKSYLALLTTSSTDDSMGDEITGKAGYSRRPIVFGDAIDGQIKNSNDIVFDVADEDWGVITSIAILDAAEEGNVLFFADLATQQEVFQDNQIMFKSEKLTITLD